MFGEVIVPVDGSALSARALGPGAALARARDAALTAVSYTSDWNHDQLKEAIATQCSTVDAPGLSMIVEPAGPGIVTRLAELVEARPSALVVMSTIGRGLTGALLGSVAEALLERTSGPAVLIGPECSTDDFQVGGTIVAGLDGSEHSEAILPVVEEWAVALPYEIELATVIDPDELAAALAPTDGIATDRELVESGYVHNRARDAAEAIGRSVDFEVLHDSNPSRALVRFAEAESAAMLALATHGRGGLARLVMGSVSMHVVHRAPCPVLAVRPPGLEVVTSPTAHTRPTDRADAEQS